MTTRSHKEITEGKAKETMHAAAAKVEEGEASDILQDTSTSEPQ